MEKNVWKIKEYDGAGNPFLLNQQGEVVIFYHDCGEREVLASSLGVFIEENFEEW